MRKFHLFLLRKDLALCRPIKKILNNWLLLPYRYLSELSLSWAVTFLGYHFPGLSFSWVVTFLGCQFIGASLYWDVTLLASFFFSVSFCSYIYPFFTCFLAKTGIFLIKFFNVYLIWCKKTPKILKYYFLFICFIK